MDIWGDILDSLGSFGKDELSALNLRRFIKDTDFIDEKSVMPDFYAAECFFLNSFVTGQMEKDFPIIARDFFINEIDKIESYEKVDHHYYTRGAGEPIREYRSLVLDLILNAANNGSDYSRNLLYYLHKIYFRNEYKQLKRFSKISGEELLLLSTEGERFEPDKVGRTIVMCKMYNIKMEKSCYPLIMVLNRMHENNVKKYERGNVSYYDKIQAIYKDQAELVGSLFEKDDYMDLISNASKFTGNVCRYLGYDSLFTEFCGDGGSGMFDSLMSSTAILKKTWPEKKFSNEEIFLYAEIYRLGTILSEVCAKMINETTQLICGNTTECEEDGYAPRFCANDIPNRKRVVEECVDSKDKMVIDKKEDEKKQDYTQSEVDSLRRKVHALEAEINQLHMEIKGKAKLSDELQVLKKQTDQDRRELVALRNHVYDLTESENENDDKVSVEEMKKTLEKKKYIIVGGHINWVNKLKAVFPEWTYISPTVSGSVPAAIIDSADKVYFFTDTISHSTYFKYMNVTREHGVDFGYIHGVNIEANMRQMYREIARD